MRDKLRKWREDNCRNSEQIVDVGEELISEHASKLGDDSKWFLLIFNLFLFEVLLNQIIKQPRHFKHLIKVEFTPCPTFLMQSFCFVMLKKSRVPVPTVTKVPRDRILLARFLLLLFFMIYEFVTQNKTLC